MIGRIEKYGPACSKGKYEGAEPAYSNGNREGYDQP
jgi:hypothetical protein